MYFSRAQLGTLGEACAAAYLQTAGYRILAQNVRADGVEIDLIALHARILVFVEVKTRRSTTHGRAEEAVDLRKQMRLVRGACAWLQMQRQSNTPFLRAMHGMRFDVIACDLGAPNQTYAPPVPAPSSRSEATVRSAIREIPPFTVGENTWHIRHFENAFDAND